MATSALPAAAGHGLLPPDRRGRLRNGAAPGDFLAAPRCGARTRAGGCCRQPAMRNGRCRMHGGLSTGPRTPAGRARCAAARRSHGFHAAEMVALRRAATACGRRLRALNALMRARSTAGHGVLPQESKIHHGGHGVHGDSAPSCARAARSTPSSSVSSVPSVVKPSFPNPATAGHGLLPSKPSLMQRVLLGSTGLGVSVRHPFTAGHGVLPSFSRRAG